MLWCDVLEKEEEMSYWQDYTDVLLALRQSDQYHHLTKAKPAIGGGSDDMTAVEKNCAALFVGLNWNANAYNKHQERG